jgi:hypothetical protein
LFLNGVTVLLEQEMKRADKTCRIRVGVCKLEQWRQLKKWRARVGIGKVYMQAQGGKPEVAPSVTTRRDTTTCSLAVTHLAARRTAWPDMICQDHGWIVDTLFGSIRLRLRLRLRLARLSMSCPDTPCTHSVHRALRRRCKMQCIHAFEAAPSTSAGRVQPLRPVLSPVARRSRLLDRRHNGKFRRPSRDS